MKQKDPVAYFMTRLPYPDGEPYDVQADQGRDQLPFKVPDILRLSWELIDGSFGVGIDQPIKTPGSRQHYREICRIQVEPYAAQPLVCVQMFVPATKEHGVLTPDRRWIRHETARTEDMWPVPSDTDGIAVAAREVHDAIQLCFLDRFNGLAGTASRCDTCPKQLSCMALNS